MILWMCERCVYLLTGGSDFFFVEKWCWKCFFSRVEFQVKMVCFYFDFLAVYDGCGPMRIFLVFF